MPYRFQPVNPGTPMDMAISAINRNFAELDAEGVTKVFRGPNGKPVMIQGKLKHGFYGIAHLDTDGNTVKLQGFDSTGTFIELLVKDGYDAYSVLGY